MKLGEFCELLQRSLPFRTTAERESVASLIETLSAFPDRTVAEAAVALRSGLTSRPARKKAGQPPPVIDVAATVDKLKCLQNDVYAWATPDLDQVRATVGLVTQGLAVAQLMSVCDQVGVVRRSKMTKAQLLEALADGPIQTLRTRFRNVGT